MPAYKIDVQADGWFSLAQADPATAPSPTEKDVADRITARLQNLRDNPQIDPTAARARLLDIAQQAFVKNDAPGALTELNWLRKLDDEDRPQHVPAYKIDAQADGWFSLAQADPATAPSPTEKDVADRITARLQNLRDNPQIDPTAARARLLDIAQQAFVKNDVPGALTELKKLDDEDIPRRSQILVSVRDGRSTGPRRVEQVVADNADTPEELSLSYIDSENYQRTAADEALLVKFRKTEFLLRGICLPRYERSYVGRLLERIFPAVVPPSSDLFGRLLIRLQRIASESFTSATASQQLSDVLLEGLYQDAWSTLAMARKSELFWRFLNALLGAFLITIGIRAIYLLFAYVDILNETVSATTERRASSALAIIFFMGVAVGAWLSYVQRGITDINTGTRGDLEALKGMLSESIHPAVRAFYVMLFAFIAMMLMHMQVVTIKLGPIFNTDNVVKQFSVALLVGLLLGLSERTLPTVVGQKATDLITRFGGTSADSGTTTPSPRSENPIADQAAPAH